MKKFPTLGAVTLATALLIAGGSPAAFAATAPGGSTDVGVDVDIAAQPGTGALAMTVEPGRATLTEDGSTGAVRQFTGTLPRVTVTDTRDPADIASGGGWYVLGSASAFTSADGQTISADHLGWSPQLVSGDEDGVSLGGDVDTSLDPAGGGETPLNRGLVDQELLYLGDPAAVPASGTTSTASANLVLKVEPTVAAGTYSSTITLSLFE